MRKSKQTGKVRTRKKPEDDLKVLSARLKKIIPYLELVLITDTGSRCGSCHRSIKKGEGVSFGKACVLTPAINVCISCMVIGVSFVREANGRIET